MGQAHSDQQQAEDETQEGGSFRLYIKVAKGKWPILYSPSYDITFGGLERIHPFDSSKWRRVYQLLVEKKMLKGDVDVIKPVEISREELLKVHTQEYIDSLNHSYNVALVVEVPPLALVPNFVVHSRVLRPFRHQTGGTVLAGKLALERGWAINIGGGFHHCSAGEGGGFCAYADITLAIHFLLKHYSTVRRVMIIDFDAHQGNGHERDFMDDERVYIMDMYNRWIYPNDMRAKAGIDMKIELDVHTSDETYLNHIRRKLPNALDEAKPDVVVYNAGTDILKGDPLGIMDITDEGVKERDEIVFREVRQRGVPIFMVTSGGYQRNNADVIANSIYNLYSKGYITAPVPTYDETDDTDVTGNDVDGDHRYRGDDDDARHGDDDKEEEEEEIEAGQHTPVDQSDPKTNSDDDAYRPS